MKTNEQKNATQRGFTLLLAALVSSIVLALGAAIYQIASKELELSSLGRDSQFAFFAADTGAECALYWDSRYGYFDTTTPATVQPPQPQCDSHSLNFIAGSRSSTYPYTLTFQFEPSGYCAVVSVEKCDGEISSAGACCDAGSTDPSCSQRQTSTQIRTLIHADGYSASCTSYTTSARALQRSVELRY